MKVSLFILAASTLTTWLLAGPFLQLLGSAVPEVHFDPQTTSTILRTIIEAPTTWLTLGVIGIGLMIWWFRRYFLIFTESLHDLALLAQNSFGFEAINRGLVHVVLEAAEGLRDMQTGLLNWNILGILAALIVVLLLLALGV